jgi:hypothetical protein
LSGSSGDSCCSWWEDGGKFRVCAILIPGDYGEGNVMSSCVDFSVCLIWEFEFPGRICIDFRNCGFVLILGWSVGVIQYLR